VESYRSAQPFSTRKCFHPELNMQSVFVIGLDPGVNVSYFALRIDVLTGDSNTDTPICSVLSFGRVKVDFRKDNVVDVLNKPLHTVWESAEISSQCTPSDSVRTLFNLVEGYRSSTHESCVVWEQQRGYLREHLGDPFVVEAHRLGWPVKVISPSDKYHRMGVTSNKQVIISIYGILFIDDVNQYCTSFDTLVIQESVELAKNYFKHISYPFFDFLENNPLKETHDIADASLFVIMALEETRWCIPTPACSLMTPSSCPVAVSLSKLYHFRSRCSNRGGANIPRRIEIASRIAACRITLQTAQLIQCVVGMDQSVIELTRSNLRNMGVCSSEASDLCMFFKMVNVSFEGKHIEMCLDSTGQRVVLFTHLHPDRYQKIQRSDGPVTYHHLFNIVYVWH
jgi:hypothetical protein